VISAANFRRLAFLTALFAYLQIALGGVVRVTGSGLGCPDWPLCHGRPYPAADVHSIIEYSHRTVGAVTGSLLIVTVVSAWIVFRRSRPVVAWLATSSLVALAAEGAIGGVVVATELAPWLVLVHLGLAMIILGCLLATAILALPASPGLPARVKPFAAALGTYVLLLTGSTVVASEADETCRAWPLCGGGLAFDLSGANAFTMLHRGAVLAIGALMVYALWAAMRRAELRPVAMATLAVLLLQVAVGAGAALTGAALFNGLHVAIATLVWAGMLAIALLTLAFAVLWVGANLLAAVLALFGALFYVFVYTIWLKRSTPQNIVIGGAAGAMPPLVGWAAATGRLDLTALALFGVVFFWTPPHFWALAQLLKSDYARAHVPMLPVVAGDQSAKRQSLVYAALTVAVSLVPFFTGSAGPVYLAGAIVLGAGLVGISLLDLERRGWTRRLWRYSMVYVAVLFAVFAVPPVLT